MRVRLFALVVVLGLFSGSCSESPNAPPPDEEEPWTYPVVLEPYTSEERTDRLDRFLQANPSVCAGISQFGRLQHHSACSMPDEVGVADSAEAVAIAVAFLERNREFFFLTGEIPPVSRAIEFGDHHWDVSFASQRIGGWIVDDTGIVLSLAQSVYGVIGRQYPEYRIPDQPLLTADEVRRSLPPWIEFRCYTMILAQLSEVANVVALPVERWSGDPIEGGTARIELRIAYCFTYRDAFDTAILYSFVDAFTGEKLFHRPAIYCW